MPQNEITENRPPNYSKWHRENLPPDCFMTDGDWFEQRKHNGKLCAVAYIETVQIPKHKTYRGYPIWESKQALAEQIQEQMGIPSFFVWNTQDCKWFYVKGVGRDQIIKMNTIEYKNFIEGL